MLICGDLNARTGSLPDYSTELGNIHIFGQNFPHNTTNLPRSNSDPQVNKNGRDLLQLCQSLGLYIVNGRLRGDSLGRHTFCSPLGNGTVDYTITDMDPFSLSAFTIKPLTPLSDHSQSLCSSKEQRQTSAHPHSPVSCLTSRNHTDGLKTVQNISRKQLTPLKSKHY